MIASNTFLNWLQRKDSEVWSLASRKAGNPGHKSYGRGFHLLVGCRVRMGLSTENRQRRFRQKAPYSWREPMLNCPQRGDVAVSILMFFYCLATEVVLFNESDRVPLMIMKVKTKLAPVQLQQVTTKMSAQSTIMCAHTL